MNQPLGVIQLQPVKNKKGGRKTKNQQSSAEKPWLGAHAAAPARSPWQKHRELIENSLLARSACVAVLNSSLLFALEFIIICFTVTSGGWSGPALGAKQTERAGRLPGQSQGQSQGLAWGCRRLLRQLQGSTVGVLSSSWKTSTETWSEEKKAFSQPGLSSAS